MYIYIYIYIYREIWGNIVCWGIRSTRNKMKKISYPKDSKKSNPIHT